MRRYVLSVVLVLLGVVAGMRQTDAAEADKNFYVGYKKGFFLKSGDDRYSLNFNGRLQVLYVFDHQENIDNLDAFDGTTNTFQIRRFYLNFSGTFFDPKLKYMLNIIPSASGRTVGDAYLNYAYSPGFEIRGGSFKLPLNRLTAQSWWRNAWP